MRQNQFADKPKTFILYICIWIQKGAGLHNEYRQKRDRVSKREREREKRRGDKAEAKKFITHFRFMPKQQTKWNKAERN